MDEGKQMIFKERREKASKDVIIKFVTNNNFNVVDEEGNLKYNGSVIPPDCTCSSFIQNNTEKYESSHAEPFLCKHLIKAKSFKEISDRAENRLRDSIKKRKDAQVLRGNLPKGWKRYDY